MARRMVGYLHLHIIPEFQLYVSFLNQIEEVAADFVATDCETCKWQIEMSTSAKVKHPISVLAEALDLEETRKLNCNK